uniref:Uncharacterized protein n=1 Tax=Rhizochromulina marina TaxID=1034831 RepID=A0A7S2RQI6_9STRA|mmetsp:Transcript_19622/g.57253  ORF Transcript_19622/g.57253 Transcript_19622/m.57253 type:complete len:538 (+) Transcript_19622:180-1793(+)
MSSRDLLGNRTKSLGGQERGGAKKHSPTSSGVCLAFSTAVVAGPPCRRGGSGLVGSFALLNAVLSVAVPAGHTVLLPSGLCSGADYLLRPPQSTVGGAHRPAGPSDFRFRYAAVCDGTAEARCGNEGHQGTVVPSLSEGRMPTAETIADASCLFAASGLCPVGQATVAFMPLRRVTAQNLCGTCRSPSFDRILPADTCRALVTLEPKRLAPSTDFRLTRAWLRARFHSSAALHDALYPSRDRLARESIGTATRSPLRHVVIDERDSLVVGLHLPGAPSTKLRSKTKNKATHSETHEKAHSGRAGLPRLARSWWEYGLELVLANAGAVNGCIKIHVIAPPDAGIHQEDLLALKSKYPSLTWQVHSPSADDDGDAEVAALLALASAHVLIAGTSPLSRLAAVLSRGVVIAPRGVLQQPLDDLRAVVTAYDHRFWDRSGVADHDFWQQETRLTRTNLRLVQLYLRQRHPIRSPAGHCLQRFTENSEGEACRVVRRRDPTEESGVANKTAATGSSRQRRFPSLLVIDCEQEPQEQNTVGRS